MQGRIIKDNARYDYTEKYLARHGYIFDENMAAADFIIFPFAKEVDKNVYNEEIFRGLKKDCRIFSGLPNDYLARMCALTGLPYFAMINDTGVATANAVPTSEGVISYMIANMPQTVAGARVLVLGFGICGSDLARRLAALGARVFALVRNREREAQAKAAGVHPLYLEGLDISGFDAIINTVPGQILPDDMLGENPLIIDIASAPYGFDENFIKNLNPKNARLPGIPGKYAIKTAGEILGEYIDNVLRGRTK